MYKVSVCQFEPKLLDVDYNLKRMMELSRGLDTDLIVYPELALSGYVFKSLNEVEGIAEEIPEGKAFQLLRNFAKEQDFSIVYGFAEKSDGKLFNSSLLLNPDGSYYVYRKTHLFYREKLFFSPGDTGFNVFPAKGKVPVGMMVCFDWQFPESARSLALAGAQVIAHPSNLVLPWCQEAMKTRSLENRVFSITTNRIGTERNGDYEETFTGASQILNTKGEILVRLATDTSEIHTVEIDPSLAANKTVTAHNDAFADRRPDMYRYR